VKYRKEVLVATERFENVRVGVELDSDDFSGDVKFRRMDVSEKLTFLKQKVNDQIVNDLVTQRLGFERHNREMVEAEVRKKYRLS
jgi:hypothetical protein